MQAPIHINSIYDELLKSINTLCHVEEANVRDKSSLSAFTSFLADNSLEIGKFGHVSDNLEKYLKGYDFSAGYDFDEERISLQKLHPLRLKLVRMGEEAKKLSLLPDRYGSRKAIDVCRKLSLTCLEKMSLEETDKVSSLCESNTKKLKELQKQLEHDEDILNQIKTAIKQDENYLKKFKAYYDELKRYVVDFPHSGQDDQQIVNNRIRAAKELYELCNKAHDSVRAIKDFCDRYNKNALVDRYVKLTENIRSTMLYSEVDNYKKSIVEIDNNAIQILSLYKEEPRELKAIKDSLKSNQKGLWKDDYDIQIALIDSLLKGNTSKKELNLSQIKTQIDGKKRKKTQDIEGTKAMYPWLQKSDKYRGIHNELTKKHIKYSTYMSNIDRLRGHRQARIVLGCIPVVGWLILLFLPSFKINWSL